jgi:hypothetical protein
MHAAAADKKKRLKDLIPFLRRGEFRSSGRNSLTRRMRGPCRFLRDPVPPRRFRSAPEVSDSRPRSALGGVQTAPIKLAGRGATPTLARPSISDDSR